MDFRNFFSITTFLLFSVFYPPIRSQLIESVSVIENSELGTVVFDLRERLSRHLDPSQLNNLTAYASQQDHFWPFALKDLRIIVAQPLDREAICEKQRALALGQHLSGLQMIGGDCPIYHCCQLLHVNVIMSPTSPTQVVFIRVAVQDLNDNAPTFPHIESPYTTISEDIAVGERILLPEAIDIDSRPFGVIDYRITQWIQGNASHFQLNVMTDEEDENEAEVNSNLGFGFMKLGRPYLNVVHPLDRETEDVYEFILQAIDGGQGERGLPYTGSVVVLIRIRDVNDNAPEFDEKSYGAVVQENTLPRKVLQFKVSDLDSGENGRIFLNIIDPTHKANNLFRISLQNSLPPAEMVGKYTPSRPAPGSFYTASLHLLEYLDAEQLPPRLKFYISATDNGQPYMSSRAEVNIDIVNVNDQAPNIVFLREGKRLASNRLAIPEVITAPESIVAEVHVTDADSSLSQLSCRITAEGDTFRLTEVNPFSNNGKSSGTDLTNYGSFMASSSSSTFLFPSYLQLTLRTKVNLDRETRALYMVIIVCTDNDSSNPLARNASLHVSISDINDETPKFEHPSYQGHVRENEPNAPVTHLTPSPAIRATDADAGRNALITFSLKEAPSTESSSNTSRRTSDVGHFRIDPRSGRLWSVPALDAEEPVEDASGEGRKYVFFVVATDDGVPERKSSSALVTIFVDDINDNPPAFEHYHYNFEVEENAPVGTMVGRISVRDADRTEANRKVRFSLRGRPEDLFLVDIDRNVGQLSMRRPVDFEKQSSISLTVIAENDVPMASQAISGRPAASIAYQTEASVIITILNVNDNRPEFIPILPHRKQIIFAWEQLPAAGGNQTAGKDQRRFCEPIPYKVIDKDCDPASRELCCMLELENTYDGMFGLLEEVPDVLCALKRPPQPQSYKLMLRARDGNGNDSLSSRIQLSVIVKSEPDYTKFTQNGSPVASPLGSRTDASDNSADLFGSDRGPGSHLGQRGTSGRSPSGILQNRDVGDLKTSSGGIPSSSSSGSKSAYSSQQMKIISILVSIAGIFCVLLLFIIAALKCGLLDNFASSKTPETVNQIPEGESLVAIPQKHEVLTIGPPGRIWNDEYRTLGENYPESVFCEDQKVSNDSGTKKRIGREGTYDISAPLSASSLSTTNSGSNYPATIMTGPRFIRPYQTILASPKIARSCKPMTKPLIVSTIRPSDHINIELTSRKPTAILAPDGRIIPLENTEFYGFSETYQSLDPSTLSKGNKKTKDGSVPTEASKVTFNLEMIPMTQACETAGGGFGRLLKNDILGEKGGDNEDEDQDKSIDDCKHDIVVYGKSTNHSSFV